MGKDCFIYAKPEQKLAEEEKLGVASLSELICQRVTFSDSWIPFNLKFQWTLQVL